MQVHCVCTMCTALHAHYMHMHMHMHVHLHLRTHMHRCAAIGSADAATWEQDVVRRPARRRVPVTTCSSGCNRACVCAQAATLCTAALCKLYPYHRRLPTPARRPRPCVP